MSNSIETVASRIRGNSYVGRGIVTGMAEDGRSAVAAYFIMGRSANSRNRIFVEKGSDVFTEPFDASKVEDPSLIIYAAIRAYENHLIVTNGDQTDTIYEALVSGRTFEAALETRTFEPDAPNFTPRISALLTMEQGTFSYRMSLLKSLDEEGSAPVRYSFSYPSKSGVGHFIHTYVGDGNPLPSFRGEPEMVFIPSDIDRFTESLWEALDEENKISLYVRYIDLASMKADNRLINKYR